MALRLERVPTLAEALARLAHPPVWAVFVSLTLPDAPGLAALDALVAATQTRPSRSWPGDMTTHSDDLP